MLQSIAAKASKKTGIYSNKQCVDTAINIGKDLVDISRNNNNINITPDLIKQTLKKQAPKVNINIINDIEEFKAIMRHAGMSPEEINRLSKTGLARSFQFGSHRGIFLTKELGDRIFAITAHEIEHYLHKQHGFGKKVVEPLLKPFYRLFKINRKNIEQILLEHEYESKILKMFGLARPNNIKTNDFKTYASYLTGLTGDKRIDAYIRAISRHFIHPKNKGAVKQLKSVKSKFEEESRAYTVSKVVDQYYKKEPPEKSFIAQLYSRVIGVLENEIKIARKSSLISQQKKTYKTGLPTTAVPDEIFL